MLCHLGPNCVLFSFTIEETWFLADSWLVEIQVFFSLVRFSEVCFNVSLLLRFVTQNVQLRVQRCNYYLLWSYPLETFFDGNLEIHWFLPVHEVSRSKQWLFSSRNEDVAHGSFRKRCRIDPGRSFLAKMCCRSFIPPKALL